ncbi:hypothetical protein M116_3525 [Bacteroides fragilis str. 3719 A10]|nr:hypothetical protein M116_3525 [Bacteroides fragilis str. 3719 A10]
MSVVLFLNDCSRKTKILSFRINKPTQKNEICFACLSTVKNTGKVMLRCSIAACDFFRVFPPNIL